MDTRVFSGANPAAPRCPHKMGINGYARSLFMEVVIGESENHWPPLKTRKPVLSPTACPFSFPQPLMSSLEKRWKWSLAHLKTNNVYAEPAHLPTFWPSHHEWLVEYGMVVWATQDAIVDWMSI